MTEDDLKRYLSEMRVAMDAYGLDTVVADAVDGGYRYFSVAEVNGQSVTISLDIDVEDYVPFG